MGKRTLTRPTFLKIKVLLEETQLPQAEIAAREGVSASMVSLVNNARTWQNYIARKRAVRAIRRPVAAAHQSQRTFKKAQEKLEQYVTRSEFKDLEQRQTIISTQLAALTEVPVLGGIFRRRMAKAVQRLPREQE